MMNMNDYQNNAYKYAAYTSPEYPFLALAEETGEVLGKLAKYMRKEQCDMRSAITYASEISFAVEADVKLRTALIKELGDVLWQLSACAVELGCNLEDIAEENLIKLADREERDVIVGEGDDR